MVSSAATVSWRGRKGNVNPKIAVIRIRNAGVDGLGHVEAAEAVDVARDPPALGDGARAASRTGRSSRTMSAIPLVTWLPDPIATASRACLSAGTSLTPSPIIAVKRPRVGEGADKRLLLVRGDAAEDRVAARRRAARPVVVGGEVGPLDDARRPRDADRVRDRGHGLAGVARDQLQVDLLLAQELDRLGGVRTQLLLEHDQRARLERRRRLAARIAAEAAPRASPKATTRRPAAVCSLERPLERRREAAGRRRRRGRPARPARSWRARRARRASARSTSTPTRTGPRQATCSGLPG